MDRREGHEPRPVEQTRAGEEAVRRGLEDEAERYRRLFHASPLGMVRETTRGEILEINQAALALLGRSDPEEVVGCPVGELYADPEDAEKGRLVLMREGSTESREVRLHHADGEDVWVQECSVLVPTPGPGGTEILRTLVDVDERRERERSLERLAYRDPLTGLANRRLLEIRAEQTLALADRRGIRVGVIFLDLVDFKDVNDALGHAVGDRLLVHVARCLEKALRTADTVARIGGDEFAVLLSEVDDAGAARRAAARLLSTISTPHALPRCDVVVEARAGVAIFPDDGTEFDALLEVADGALIRAKGGEIDVVSGWGTAGAAETAEA